MSSFLRCSSPFKKFETVPFLFFFGVVVEGLYKVGHCLTSTQAPSAINGSSFFFESSSSDSMLPFPRCKIRQRLPYEVAPLSVGK